jgi:hypothetical protein
MKSRKPNRKLAIGEICAPRRDKRTWAIGYIQDGEFRPSIIGFTREDAEKQLAMAKRGATTQ